MKRTRRDERRRGSSRRAQNSRRAAPRCEPPLGPAADGRGRNRDRRAARTFAGMLATGSSGQIGTIMFVPWVALLAAELGPTVGGLAGVAATGLYLAATEMVGLPHDPTTLMLRLAPLVGVGLAAGYSSRRISSDALELQATTAVQRALLDSTLDGICLTDPSGAVAVRERPAPGDRAGARATAARHRDGTAARARRADDRTESLQRADARART